MKKEFKGVNVPKFMDEFISNGIRVIKADIVDEITSIFEFEEEQDIELIEKIYAEHNPMEIKPITDSERIVQLENAILELAAIIGGE